MKVKLLSAVLSALGIVPIANFTKDATDIDNLTTPGFYWTSLSMSEDGTLPAYGASGVLIHLPRNASNKTQIFFSAASYGSTIWMRTTYLGVWGAWRQCMATTT